MDISFTYVAEDKSRFETPELFSDCLVDLFEAPDVLKHFGAFGGTEESLQAAGFLPDFVLDYRENMGSNMQWILETTEEERAAASDAAYEQFLEDHGDREFPEVDFTFEATQAEEWADLWLRLLATASFQKPENLQAMLPYNHESVEYVKRNLEQLRSQAQEAAGSGVQLRIEAMMG